MGSDFFQRSKKTINAARDRDRERLAQETLFTRHPECARYAARARLRAGVILKKDEELLVQKYGAILCATRGLEVVADFESPIAAMLDAVDCAGGILEGKVVNVMELINSAEIILCP
jgi:hypothetical protein